MPVLPPMQSEHALQPRWSSQDPKTGQWAEYGLVDARKIESAYTVGNDSTTLTIGGKQFTIKFSEMRQYNSLGGSRAIKRL